MVAKWEYVFGIMAQTVGSTERLRMISGFTQRNIIPVIQVTKVAPIVQLVKDVRVIIVGKSKYTIA